MKSGRQKIKELKLRVAELEWLVAHYKFALEKTRPGDYFHAPVYVRPARTIITDRSTKIIC